MPDFADRVKETTTTAGTGTVDLAGAATGFRTFVAGIGNGNSCYYAIVHQSAAEWEVGIGTVTDATPDTLSRTTILASSNAGSAVDFSAGTKDAFVTLAAAAVAKAALSNLASVAINTDLLPASSQGLGNASFPFLASFIGSTTQYESLSQSAGLLTHAALGGATNIGFAFSTKGTGTLLVNTGEGFIVDKATNGVLNDIVNLKYQTATKFAVRYDGEITAVGKITFNTTAASDISFAGVAGLGHNGTGVVEVNNGTAGQWGALLTGVRDAGTTTVTNGLTVGHQSTGTPDVGLGSAVLFNINSSTTADQNAARIAALWTDATHASRTADLVIYTVNSAAALAEAGRFTGAGNLTVTGTITSGGVAVPTISSTSTLTNKRITQREGTVASSATPTPDADAVDIYTVTALAAGATFGAPTGTPTQGQKLMIRIKDNGGAQTLAWNAIYRAIGVTLPTTTVTSKTLYVGCVFNSTDSVWDVLATAQQA